MTLIDTIDTFIALRDHQNFSRAIHQIIHQIPNFDLDSKVQVFETTIRVLGGLLSGHLFAKDPQNVWNTTHHSTTQSPLVDYDDQLLVLAKDLADRMLPAFRASKTGIPYARINLRYGILPGEGTETCTAGAGSLLLEFATLSRLVGDPVYENVAKVAFYALWNRRSPINLLGNTIDVHTGNWAYGISSIGAGIDSFYEYILKSHILLQDDSMLDLWNQAYKSVMTYMRSPDGFWYRGVNMQTGAVATTTIDSLAAFWPGLLVLAGDIEGAIKSHMTYANLWFRYSGIPEVFDIHRKQATALGYPLRPEFVESNYFLYRATKDEYYLEVAERVLLDLVNRTWVDCGLASIENLETGKLEDRMHSFMLSETLKYLYLTFDEENPINHVDESFIFTTEGHILWIPSDRRSSERQTSSRRWEERESLDSDQLSRQGQPALNSSNPQNFDRARSPAQKPATCSVYLSSSSLSKLSSPLKPSISGRTDLEYAKMITGSPGPSITPNTPSSSLTSDPTAWFEYGYCEVPAVDDNLIELIFSHSDSEVDRNPGHDKVEFSFEPQPSASSSSPSSDQPPGRLKPHDSRPLQPGHDVHHPTALVKLLAGLTFSLRKSNSQDTYEIVKIGTYSLPSKTKVILSDPYAIKILKSNDESEKISARDRDHLTGIRIVYEDEDDRRDANSRPMGSKSISRLVMMATFGPDVRLPGSSPLSVGSPARELVRLNRSNEDGCLPIEPDGSKPTTGTILADDPSELDVGGKVVIVKRGGCTFADKVQNALLAGAIGVIVTNEDEKLLIPTSDRIEARDERENLMASAEGEAGRRDGGEDRDESVEARLGTIPLLFTTWETGRSIEYLLGPTDEDHRADADRDPAGSRGSPRTPAGPTRASRKVWVEIVEDPFELLDRPIDDPRLHHASQDPSSPHHHPPHRHRQPNLVVINGYKLSNLVLKKV